MTCTNCDQFSLVFLGHEEIKKFESLPDFRNMTSQFCAKVASYNTPFTVSLHVCGNLFYKTRPLQNVARYSGHATGTVSPARKTVGISFTDQGVTD